MHEPRRTPYVIMVAALATPLFAVSARANVNLGFEPAQQTVGVGDTVMIGLVAYSDNDLLQSIGAAEVILNWDPSFLELVGHIDNGPYEWFSSSFYDDTVFDGLNETFLDGDALYRAMAQLAPSPPAFAPPDGLLVTTLRFSALAPTDMTELTIPPVAGMYTQTIVLDGFTPGLDVTGTLGSAEITIVPEPASLALLGIATVGLLRRRRR